ncbi:hypothetical protein VTK73DRAFT_4210 [Phialemonium thermophilum]|uniref:6-methylsalicylate decarboxylase n=1 Tax=Phialemonium thermophilum TaxID=223376 RepID=A0ABR3WUL6_9PEZI
MFASRYSVVFLVAAVPLLFLSVEPLYNVLRQLAAFFFVAAGTNGRIDTHFHALPPEYLEALISAGGDPSGFPTPEWSLGSAINSMDAIGTSLGILSVSSPGVPVVGTGEAGRKLARSLNEKLAEYATQTEYKGRIGFFGVLPDWQDVNGTLSELDFLYRQQKLCNGIAAYTNYGDRLLGDPLFVPIWERLQVYKSLVFVHPSVLDIKPRFIGPSIPQPIVDYPLATTRAAVDLVMTGTVRASPDVDIILSHAGGALPFVGSRAIKSLALPAVSGISKVSLLQARNDFARFYYDIALSTSAAQLDGLLDFTNPGHILFGSDFPYVPQLGIKAMTVEYAEYVATNPRGKEIQPETLTANSVRLLKKHAQGLVLA